MCQAYESLSHVYSWFEARTCKCGHYHSQHGPKRTQETASQPAFIGANCPNWIPYSDFKVCPCRKCECPNCELKKYGLKSIHDS